MAFAVRGEIFAASAKDGGDAARVTMTPAAESQVAWSPDSRRVVYASERSGAARLFTYDFATSREAPLTTGDASDGDFAPRFSPDGAMVAYVRGGTELRLIDVVSKRDRSLAKGLIADPLGPGRPIAWSPDGNWIAYFTAGTRGFTNVSAVPAGGGTSHQVSFFANGNATGVSWAPDGTFLLFDTSQRTENGELARVDLILRTPRFREDQFKDLFNEENAPRTPSQPNPQSLTAVPDVLNGAERAAIVGGEASSQTATQSRSRSFSTTFASGPPSCRPASTSERRSSALTVRRSS